MPANTSPRVPSIYAMVQLVAPRLGERCGDPADIADEILAQLSLAAQEMQELARLLGEAN